MIMRVDGVGFTVSDLDRLVAFYTGVLPFTIVGEKVEMGGEDWEQLTGLVGARARTITLGLGEAALRLTQYSAPEGGRAIPPDSRSNDLWFQHIAIVVSDIDAAYRLLREHQAQHVSSMPQTLPPYLPAAAGIRAFYFRDPEGHNLELIWYPPGKNSPRWRRSDALFLGVDHTAIAVRHTARSRVFYEDGLGLAFAGESENYGSEQEHLNMVFGAHLQITGLAARQGGIGVELLEYLSPPGGRPVPSDSRPNDQWHWETGLITDDLEGDLEKCLALGATPVSSGITAGRSFLLRDPDGHALKLSAAQGELSHQG